VRRAEAILTAVDHVENVAVEQTRAVARRHWLTRSAGRRRSFRVLFGPRRPGVFGDFLTIEQADGPVTVGVQARRA
jgi:hypothetical protein